MFIKVENPSEFHNDPVRATVISLRCPNPRCRRQGTFEIIQIPGTGVIPDVGFDIPSAGFFITGQRRCPHPECRTHIFFVFQRNGNRLIASYPAERIDFDSTNIPEKVVDTFQEAITDHANGCFISAAIMVRKTLEELCRDRGATKGKNLKDRIKELGTTIVLPKELLDGIDELRLLGNDAAHFEAQVYDNVGEDEVKLAIDLTKEVLKAVYQYSDLVKRLQALKKTP